MHYDVIILGATFTAAGIAQVLNDRCLILERRPQAGYEYFNAIKFGSDYSEPLKSKAAGSLSERFKDKKAFLEDRICLFDCAAPFYSLLNEKNVMLNMETVSVEQNDNGFTVTAHGVSGYRTYTAKKIIDTRTLPQMITEKSLNVLINGNSACSFAESISDKVEKWGYEGDLVIKCAVDTACDYSAARKTVANIIKKMPEGCKAVLVADMFDCTVNGSYPKTHNGITYLPSCSFANPLLSFDAGVLYAEEVLK